MHTGRRSLSVLALLGLFAEVVPAQPVPAPDSHCSRAGSPLDPSLCVQQLSLKKHELRVDVTLPRELPMPPAIQLSIDGAAQALARTNPIVQWSTAGDPMDLAILVQTANVDSGYWQKVKSGLNGVLDAVFVRSSSRVAIIGYGYVGTRFLPEVWFRGDADARGALNQLNTAPAEEGKRLQLSHALRTVLDRFPANAGDRRRMLLLFSDGIPKEGKADWTTIFGSEMGEKAKRERITVSIVSLPDMKPPKELVSGVQMTGGSVYFPQEQVSAAPASGALVLPDAFARVASEIRGQWLLRFTPTKKLEETAAGQTSHDVVLTIGQYRVAAQFPVFVPAAHETPSESSAASDERLHDAGRQVQSSARLGALWLLLGLGCLAMAGGSVWWLMRQKMTRGLPLRTVLALEFPGLFARFRTPASSRGPVMMLYDLQSRQTHVIPWLPYSIGNDADCDLVLPGLKSPLSCCVVGRQADQGVVLSPLRMGPNGRVRAGQLDLVGPSPIADRCELEVGTHRFVYLETRFA